MTRPAIAVEPATPADEPALRRLLREAPFAGALSVTLEREPSFDLAAAVEGDRHQVLVGRLAGGEVVGMAARSVRTALVNGAPARLGYLGQLRVGAAGRGRLGALRRGFTMLAADRRPDELPFDLTSIVSDNGPARRLLEAGLRGMPSYRPLGDLVTLALSARPRRDAAPPGTAIIRGAPERLGEIAGFLRREGARRQLAPCPSAAELASPERSRGLAPRDFLLVERGGRLVGCAALWDQRGFKQAVVRRYPAILALLRPLLSLAAPMLRLPRLPPVGVPVAAAFLAFLAVVDDDPVALDALLDAALADARARHLDLLLLGLAARHPLLARVKARPHLAYRSMLYAVHGPAGAAAVDALDGRLLGPEVATL